MKKKLVYVRYILPAVFAVLTVAGAFIPNVAFTLEMNKLETRSVAAIMVDAWQQCRLYISGSASFAGDATAAFSVWVIAGIIVTVLLAAVSLGVSVWSSVMAMQVVRFEPNDEKSIRARRVLCKVLPGRAWMLAANLLVVVPALFPNYLAAVYTRVLYLNTEVNNGLIWIALVLGILSAVLTFALRGIERQFNMDVFAAPAAKQ